MKKKILTEVAASLLVLLFLYASLSQWLDFKTFTGNINNQPLPNSLTPFIKWAMPVLELLIAAGLIFERTRRKALLASLVYLSVLTIYIVLILLNVFGWVPCSCSGLIKVLSWEQHLWFNLFFIVVALIGFLLGKNSPYNSTSTPRTMLN